MPEPTAGPPVPTAEPPAGMLRRIVRFIPKLDDLGIRLGDWPGNAWVTRLNAIQIVVWLVVGGAILMRTGHFTYDQAYFYELSVRVAEHLRPAAYGPFVSGFRPSPLTPGGLMYDVYALPFLFFRDPRWGLAWIDLLAASGAWLLDRGLRRLGGAPPLRLALVTFATWAMFHARLTSTFWNANLFLFTTPGLLYVTARTISAARLWPWGLAFGGLAALGVQTHLSGAMAVALCSAVLVLRRPSALWSLWSLGTLAAFAVTFLPFVFTDRAVGYADWHLVRAATPELHTLEWPTLRQCLLAPVTFAAHPDRYDAMFPPFQGWMAVVIGVSAWAALAAAVLGVVARFPLKLVAVVAYVALPRFFEVVNRGYLDHYVAAVIPFCQLWPAAGVALLLSGPRPLKVLGGVYLWAFALSGAALLLAQAEGNWVVWPQNPWNGRPVSVQIERTKQLLDMNRPLYSGPGDESAFVHAVLAKRLFQRELEFSVYGQSCHVDVILSGVAPPLPSTTTSKLIPLAANSAFVCP
jgi:hypothetical protein